MSRKRKIIRVRRKGRVIEIAPQVHEYNQRKKRERLQAKQKEVTSVKSN